MTNSRGTTGSTRTTGTTGTTGATTQNPDGRATLSDRAARADRN
jgi:hypothetical protein